MNQGKLSIATDLFRSGKSGYDTPSATKYVVKDHHFLFTEFNSYYLRSCFAQLCISVYSHVSMIYECID